MKTDSKFKIQNSKSRIHSPSGFTLIEVLIGVTIFAVGVLALATMQIATIRGTEQASGTTEAAVVASRTLEILASLPWAHADVQNTNTTADGTNYGLDNTDAGTTDAPANPTATGLARAPVNAAGQTFNVFWNVAPSVPIANTKTVKVTVVYTERGATRRVAVQRVIPRII